MDYKESLLQKFTLVFQFCSLANGLFHKLGWGTGKSKNEISEARSFFLVIKMNVYEDPNMPKNKNEHFWHSFKSRITLTT